MSKSEKRTSNNPVDLKKKLEIQDRRIRELEQELALAHRQTSGGSGWSPPEQAVLDREEIHRLALDAAAVGIWDWDVDSGHTTWSRTALEIAGAGKTITKHRDWESRIHPEDRSEVLKALNVHLEGGTPDFRCEYRLLDDDGEWRWVIDRGRVVSRDTDGEPLRMVGTITGIHARKQAEQMLRTSEERFKNLFTSMSTGVAIYVAIDDGEDFVFTDINPAGEQSTQARKEDVLGKRVSECFPAVGKIGLLEVFRRVWETGEPGFHPAVHYHDGRISTWVENRVFKLTTGEVVAIFDDVTMRRTAEEALSVSQERLRRVLDASPDAVVVTDMGRRVVDCNEAALKIHGFSSKDELIGRNALEFIHPDYLAFARERAERVLEHGSVKDIRYELMRADGSTFPAEMSASVILGQSDEPTGFVAITRDITERESLTDQLIHAQKMEAVGKLAGGIAHDFRNQLTVIQGFSNMLLRRDLIKEEGSDLLEEVLKATARSLLLTHQLLSFSRKQVLRPENVDLCEIVMGLQTTMARMIGEDVQLTVSPDKGGASVCTAVLDPAQLQQALVNLVVNARDAMPAGGDLEIETACVDLNSDPTSSGDEFKPGRYVMIEVSDSGTGMDEATKQRVFEPFFTTKKNGEGTGLGLAMVYGFVKQSGGTLEVESVQNRGTAIRLYFPFVEPEHTTVEPGIETDEVRSGRETILVVEDEDPVRRMIVESLAEVGYTVIEARNASKALEVLRDEQHTIDLVVSDVIMPGANGFELADEMKTFVPGIPVLHITGYAPKDLAKRGLSRSDLDLLTKPFTHGELVSAIRERLDVG